MRGADVAVELWRPGQGTTRAGVRVRSIPWLSRRAGGSGADGAGAAGASRGRLGPSSRRAAKRRRRELAERTGRSEWRRRPRDGEEKQGR